MHFLQRRQPNEPSTEDNRTRYAFPRARSATPQIARSADTAKRGFLTFVRFHSAMKIKDTGKTDYFVQDLNSADTMIKERIARKFQLLDCQQKVGIVDDLKEPQLNTRRGLPTGLRKALSSPTRMKRELKENTVPVAPFLRPRAYLTGYVPSPDPPRQCAKAPTYHWGLLRLRAA